MNGVEFIFDWRGPLLNTSIRDRDKEDISIMKRFDEFNYWSVSFRCNIVVRRGACAYPPKVPKKCPTHKKWSLIVLKNISHFFTGQAEHLYSQSLAAHVQSNKIRNWTNMRQKNAVENAGICRWYVETIEKEQNLLLMIRISSMLSK